MKILAALFWLIFSTAGFAQTIGVKAGDHPGFTRLVLELAHVADWQMGRTAEGYALRINGEHQRFDLSNVFNEIQRNRLAAIWTDPKTGELQLGIACACYATPFEFRPGIIVIDLRDGTPPKGSSFELALDGGGVQKLGAHSSLRPRPRPQRSADTPRSTSALDAAYDWLEPGQTTPVVPAGPMIVIDTMHSDISPLKDALLRQLSRGAAQGIVQMALPSLADRNAGSPLATGPRATIHLGEAPGFAVATARPPENKLIKDGADCTPDAQLDVTAWGGDQPASSEIAESRAGLIGEFDAPDQKAVIRAAKLLIHLSFGAEAKQLLIQMPVDDPDSKLWQGMAQIVDGATDAAGPFAGMQTCDTAAALWAALEAPQLHQPRTEAVLRSFSALPAHLRRSLGPALAAKFLAIDDVATARTLSSAAQRGAAETGPDIAVMDATISLASGDAHGAAERLAPVLAEAGPSTADTLIALVDARLAAGEAIDPETPTALAALIREQADGDLEPALRRAEILALAALGDFDQAFALLPEMTNAAPDLWHLLAKSGSDTAILNHAVLPPDGPFPTISVEDRNQIATQLLALSLPDVALIWIGKMTKDTPAADRILAAKANLSKGDADASLQLVEDLDDSATAEVRAQALWQLGRFDEAAAAWATAGNTKEQLRAQGWAHDWHEVSKSDGSPWQVAAGLLTADRSQDVVNAPGPLALGTALVAESAAARATLAALLAAVPGPQPAN